MHPGAVWAQQVVRETRYMMPISGSPSPLYWLRITRSCDCMREGIRAFWASRCELEPVCTRVYMTHSLLVCALHAQRCLLETLSKSPQCDNWLPGVLVSLLLIIVIPSRREKKMKKKKKWVLDEICKVCSFVGETDPKSASTLFARKNIESVRQRGPDPRQPVSRLLPVAVGASGPWFLIQCLD